jgi:hypothetical protein
MLINSAAAMKLRVFSFHHGGERPLFHWRADVSMEPMEGVHHGNPGSGDAL